MNKNVFQIFTEKELKTLITESIADYFSQSPALENQNSESVWLTCEQAAEYLHISLPSLHKATKEGKLTACRINRIKLYSKAELDKAVANLKIRYK
ncbi:MAG TPA: helix-turn-helix domain-containing protein [Flavisolibacter sp.]|jgi:excisionase family DNA binding protein|nr:helix-turn-helix domain-containing protein [Flavisolibacter sp.]